MAVLLRDGPSCAKPSDVSTSSPPIDREGALSRFNESVGTIAGLLGDISKPLRRCAHNHDRFLVEDGFAYMWKDAKQQIGRGDGEAAKAILRAQGASAPFMEAIRTLLRVELPLIHVSPMSTPSAFRWRSASRRISLPMEGTRYIKSLIQPSTRLAVLALLR